MSINKNDFTDVKVGDMVFYNQEVGHYWDDRQWFSIPTKVVKVTKTQFACENGNRYFKEGGCQFAGSSYMDKAFKEGKDETQKMEKYKSHLNFLSEVKNEIYKLRDNVNRLKVSNTDRSDLKKLLDAINKIQNGLKNDNNN